MPLSISDVSIRYIPTSLVVHSDFELYEPCLPADMPPYRMKTDISCLRQKYTCAVGHKPNSLNGNVGLVLSAMAECNVCKPLIISGNIIWTVRCFVFDRICIINPLCIDSNAFICYYSITSIYKQEVYVK